MVKGSKGLTASNAVAVIDDIEVPALVEEAGNNAKFAWDEFLYGALSNAHTRRSYGKAVGDLLKAADDAGLSLAQISPKFIRKYLEQMSVSIPTKKLRLSAMKNFFDLAVTRHAVPLNPALSVRGERYSVIEGKTPEITVSQVRKLIKVCDENSLIGLRDKTIISTLIYTAARVGAVVNLSVEDFSQSGEQAVLKFGEKGGKAREIPVRSDLQALIRAYIERSQVGLSKSSPLFRSAKGKCDELTERGLTANNVRDMIKRRLKQAKLPGNFSPHSFRVCALTDLLKQEIPREDVQYLAGHADARTTSLYDRRSRKVTRNIVERISV